MKGDFTRFSHQPPRHYAGVLMQQGRVTLDADWNEQFEIEDHRWRVQTIDTIGMACAPIGAAGFGLTFTPGGEDLIIGEGRIYVDGLLVENHHGTWVDIVEVIDGDGDGDGRGVVADLAPDGIEFATGHWVELRWGDPAGNGSAIGQVTAVDADEMSITIDLVGGPDGVPPNLAIRRLVTYLTQPFYVADAEPPFGDVFTPREWDAQRHLLYLDVWRRHVTAIEDPHIREVALGGPDTATRVQTAWAVRVLFDDDEPVDASNLGCHDPLDVWDALTAPKAGRMTARAEAVEDPEDPCAILPEAGYRGLENRLYRVEIHDPGPLGTATFKWSRDNGSILSSITDFPANDEVQVHSLGKDAVLRFGADDRVEAFSNETEFSGLPGTLAAIVGAPDDAERLITLDTDVSLYQNHHAPRMRRWDQAADPIVTAAAFTDLEDGVQVSFSDGPFEVGDYWVIPARVATGDVEGFVDSPPRGIHHHYVRLALVTWSDLITDCRRMFSPLCELPMGGSAEGCATVTVGDGVTSTGDFTSIQAAVDAVPVGGPGMVQILPGTYRLDAPVRVAHARLTIAGCDDQTRVIARQSAVFGLEGCAEVRIERLRIEGNDPLGAIVVVSSREISIDRCTVMNGTVAASDIDALAAAPVAAPRSSTLLMNLDPSGPAIGVYGAVWMWITGNRLLGSPGVSAQAAGLTVHDNTMISGGVWVRDGSAAVRVLSNVIRGGTGPGVALGGFARTESPSRQATGVRFVEVAHNQIVETGQAGITTVSGVEREEGDRDPVIVGMNRLAAFDAGAEIENLRANIPDLDSVRFVQPAIDDLRIVAIPAVGDIEDVAIASNTIVGCATDAPNPVFDPEGTGGVVLREVIGARVLDNEIIDNGRRRRAVGVFLPGCETVDVTGNRIRGNGSDEGRYADFVSGGEVEGPNPLVVNDIEFELVDSGQTSVIPLFGFLAPQSFRIRVPEPVTYACLTYLALSPVSASALDEAGNVVASAELSAGLETVDFSTDEEFTVIQFEFDQVSDSFPTMSVLSFCAGEPCRYYQGGIIGTELDASGLEAAVAVRDNDVTTPAGQALILVGVGTILAADNRLVAGGSTLQPCSSGIFGRSLPPALLPKTVFIYDAGQSILLGNRDLFAGGGNLAAAAPSADAPLGTLGGAVMYERSSEAAIGINSLAARERESEPDGRVLFHGNQVAYRPDRDGSVLWSVGIASFDDVGLLDNQFAAEAPGGLILTDVLAFGAMLRVADNSLVEPLLNAAYSGILFGLLTHATGNQAAHCLSVIGLLGRVEDNQVIIETFLQDHCRQLQGVLGAGMSAFAMTLGGR